jgi:hypothetical protein
LVDEILSGCAEGWPQGQGQCPQAAAARGLEQWQLQDLFVKVHGNVCAKLVWEALQQLQASRWGGLGWQKRKLLPVSSLHPVQHQEQGEVQQKV